MKLVNPNVVNQIGELVWAETIFSTYLGIV